MWSWTELILTQSELAPVAEQAMSGSASFLSTCSALTADNEPTLSPSPVTPTSASSVLSSPLPLRHCVNVCQQELVTRRSPTRRRRLACSTACAHSLCPHRAVRVSTAL